MAHRTSLICAVVLGCGCGGSNQADGKCEPAQCADLASSYAAGTAACLDDRPGWDVSTCERVGDTSAELVKPAEREQRWMDARCNDGSAFGFLVRLGTSDEFVVHLQGGGWCDDVGVPCSFREGEVPDLLVGPPEPDGERFPLQQGGVLDDDPAQNVLANATHVYALYCSSDAWSGTRTTTFQTSAASFGGAWLFSGHYNVVAMLDILEERYGLDPADSDTRILFSGTSGGGMGVVTNADYVAARYPGKVKVLIDAAWMPDWDDANHRIGTSMLADAEVFDGAVATWDGIVDESCAAAYGADDRGHCLIGPLLYPHLDMPVLVQQCSHDPRYLAIHLPNLTFPVLPTDEYYDDVIALEPLLAGTIQTSLTDVTWAFSGSQRKFSATEICHGLATESLLWTYCDGFPSCQGPSFRDVVRDFWTDAPPVNEVF